MVYFKDGSPINALNSLSNSADTVLSSVNTICEFKFPAYGANNPRVRFAQVEALFITRGIRSRATKYAHVVGTVPIVIAAEFGDQIDQVPESEPYDKIKAAVIQRTSVSDEKRLRQLLRSCELGNKRPSQLLRHMK